MDYESLSLSQEWAFAGEIPPYDEPITSVDGGHLGLCPDGSTYCFSYWLSPEVPIQDGTVYRSRWEVGSSSTESDMSVQFRLRTNQTGTWAAWDRVVNSNLGQAPSMSETKFYDILFDSHVTGTTDENILFSFDILSFDPEDDVTSWLYLQSVVVQEITISP